MPEKNLTNNSVLYSDVTPLVENFNLRQVYARNSSDITISQLAFVKQNLQHHNATIKIKESKLI